MPETAVLPNAFRRVAGRPAGQREDLVARLRDLAGAYPAGIGILKEFLQNADDAGATWVRFTLDLRTHSAAQRPDERMEHLFGPALLVESDQTFTEQDVLNIQRIGAAGKIDDAGKTGRFGLGFNTVYSITDYPSFATRDLIMTFDPYFDTVAVRGEEPGIDWPLDALWTDAPDWPRAFDLSAGAAWIDTTVFRLPLRLPTQSAPNRISRTPIEPSAVREILCSLSDWGERLVLYLRSVVHVEARVLHPDGRAELLVDVRTSNEQEVQAARGAVLPGVGESTGQVLERAHRPDAVRVYAHHFTVSSGGDTTPHSWVVCQGLFLGEEGEVLAAARGMMGIGEKAIPLGGAAIRVTAIGPEGLLPVATPGTIACSLPIPQALPIALALNGRWSLSSARDHVRFGTDSGEEAPKINWNRVLAEQVVPAAVARLMGGLRDRLDSAGALALYAALPDLRQLISPFDRALGAGIYQALAACRSIRVEAGETSDWRLPGEATLPPAWSAPLVDACIADNLELAVPVPPDHVLHGLAEVDEAPQALTPSEARAWLGELGGWAGPPKDAPRACLRSRDMVFELARFCSGGGKASLDGVPVAWMHDGSLRTFGQGDPIYLGGEAARSLFRSQRTWFLDAELERGAPILEKQAKHLFELTAGRVIATLDTLLPKGRDDGWDPAGTGALNEAWLTELYLWLGALPDLKSHLLALKSLAMVPDSKGRLVRPGTAMTPLLPPAGMSGALARALDAFGVPIVVGSSPLLSAVRAFRHAAGEMVWEATPDDVLDTLPHCIESFPAESPHRPVLLSWFAAAYEAKALSSKALAYLKELPLWPTQEGRFVSASERDVFLPDYVPPGGFSRLTLLQVAEPWRPLLEALGVSKLELGEWILRVFLKDYGKLDAPGRARALRWLRDKGLDALTGPEGSINKLREALRDTPLIVADDGTLQPVARLYDPDARGAVAVLGPVARFPDWSGEYASEPDKWGAFFKRLHLQSQPLDRDVIARVEQLLHDLTPENSDSTEGALLAVYDFLGVHWGKSEGNERTELARKLKELAWMPTMQRPAHVHEVALFRRPEPRFMVPARVYPARLLHDAASQVAFVAAGRESGPVRQALGMPGEVPPRVALTHFMAVRDAWLATGSGGMQPEAVGRVASAFYRRVGSLLGARTENTVHLIAIKDALAAAPCIWDSTASRFWRPGEAFADGASWLAGLRGSVAATGQDGAGLDFLGRKPQPAAEDLVAVLRELGTRHSGTALPQPLLDVALRCWHLLSETTDRLTPDLPVPTMAGELRPVAETLVDDASYWRDRLSSAQLPWLHEKIQPSSALIAGAKRASVVVEERCQSWVDDAPPEVHSLCADRQAHLESAGFVSGLRRLLAQSHPQAEPPDVMRVRRVSKIKLVPRGEIHAGLVCPQFGVDESVGVEEVACLLDDEGRVRSVWVASEDAEAVALELSRALVRLLREEGIEAVDEINEAALEAILRCHTDHVERTLDRRRVPSLVRDVNASFDDEGEETANWNEEGEADPVGAESFDAVEGDEAELIGAPEEAELEASAHEEAAASERGRHIARPDRATVRSGKGEAYMPAASTARAPVEPQERTSMGPSVSGPRDLPATGGADAAPQRSAAPAPRLPSTLPGATPGVQQAAPTGGASGVGGLPAIDAPPRARQPLTGRVLGASASGSITDGPRAAPTVPRQGQGGAKSKRRGQLLSYVEFAGGGRGRDADVGEVARRMTEDAALRFVDEEEGRRGSRVTPMARENEGYDREILVPGETETRFVEVKGLSGAWDARGVRLTPAELRAAHAFQYQYWVYVVEFAQDPARRRLHRLRGPANQVTAYCLDHVWASLAEPEEVALVPAEGLLLFEGERALGVIETAQARGEAIKLVVVGEGGIRCRLTWNPSRHRLQTRNT